MKILFISLGCDKNLADTEEMLGILKGEGYTFTDDEREADVIIVNTCCFINDAKEESITTICEMAECKKLYNCKSLIVTGCLAQRYKDEILKEIPEVDALVGTSSYDTIAEAVRDTMEGKRSVKLMETDRLPGTETDRVVTTGGWYAYLKIAEGCNKNCTYCIIPKIRGHYRSVPMEKLIKQAEKLAEDGVKELILVAQETTLYGVDLYGEKSLHRLLRELCKIEGIVFIRVLYCYPEEIYDEFIETIKSEEKICNYLDMPIQHCNDEILRRMGRRTNKKQLTDIIGKLRTEIPDIIIRTTLIAGFPGETEEAYEELMEFVDGLEFDRLGVFAYSQEENTAAAEFENQVEDEEKERRRAGLMELQQEIAFEKSEAMIGREFTAVVEGKVADENAYIARTYMDAPGVDGYVFLDSDTELLSGDLVRVRITAASGYDLIGEKIEI